MLVNDDILQPIFRIKIYSISYLNTIYNVGCIKSFVDDLIWTRYCKHESSLVLRSAEVLPLFIDLCNRFEISISYQLPFHPPTYHTPLVVYGNNQELASPQTNPDKERQSSIATIVDMMVPIACGVPCASVRLNFLRVILLHDDTIPNQTTINNLPYLLC